MTLDYLYDFDGIFVETEIVMPISHQLMIHPDNTEIEKIYSHEGTSKLWRNVIIFLEKRI